MPIESGFTGVNKKTYPNGDVYEGNLKDDQPHGKGKMTYIEDGRVYEGDWVDGKRNGKGTPCQWAMFGQVLQRPEGSYFRCSLPQSVSSRYSL